MDLSQYQIVVIMDTYDVYEHDPMVRQLLAETWGMKLRGYKQYFSYGVCPNDVTDFLYNHIIICKKDGGNLIPVAGIKNCTVEQCERMKREFPICAHIFPVVNNPFSLHVEEIKNWIDRFEKTKVGYSFGFTISPELPKLEKNFLNHLIYSAFHFFYIEMGIPNIIHGVNVRNKVADAMSRIGFNVLTSRGVPLEDVKMKSLDNLVTRIMILENNLLNKVFIDEIQSYRPLWDNKVLLTHNLNQNRKVA